MSLNLHKRHKYADPYHTNYRYIRNMTSLQMIPLGKMTSDGGYIYISIWAVPDTWTSKKGAELSVESFIDELDNGIMGL